MRGVEVKHNSQGFEVRRLPILMIHLGMQSVKEISNMTYNNLIGLVPCPVLSRSAWIESFWNQDHGAIAPQQTPC